MSKAYEDINSVTTLLQLDGTVFSKHIFEESQANGFHLVYEPLASTEFVPKLSIDSYP